MKTLLTSLLLLSSLWHKSKCAAIGLSDVHATQPTVEEGNHLKHFWDGFLLDDEETMDRNNSPSTENKKSGEKNGFKDFIPMLDPEADSDLIEKFGDFSLLRHQIKQRKSRKLHQRSKRLVVNEIERWENGTIPYIIDEPYFTSLQINLILRGMAHWENCTCIRFKNRTNERTYLDIYPGGGCSSFVGKGYGGPQGLSLAPRCFLKPQTVIHELGHAIGLFHEHSRPDRDKYIRIIYPCIRERVDRGQFNKVENDYYSTYSTQGLPYDYNSIMHYDGDQFAKDSCKATIEALDPTIICGNAVELSLLDIIRVNKLYECQVPFPPKTTHWVPLDPPEDIIPPRPHSCGALIMGEYNGSVSSPGYPQFEPDTSCSWQIIVPEGYRVKITFESFGLKTGYLTRCSDGNITFLQLDYTKRIFSRICRYSMNRNRPYYTSHNEAHIEYRSGLKSSNDPSKGFSANFTSVDINECEEKAYCSHKCINTPGSYICTCEKGYFLSADGHTCFVLNECAVDGSLCEYKCRMLGGHFKCICPDGSDQIGPTCAQNPQDPTPTTAPTVSSPDPSTNSLPSPSIKQTTTSAFMEQLTTSPISTEQPTTSPISTEQPTTSPISTEQPTTSPISTEQPTTSPISTEQSTTSPISTEQPTTSPISTEQPTTSPISTEQSTTSPISTEQPTTSPISTEQPTTSPISTEQPTTSPISTKQPTTSPISTEQLTTSPKKCPPPIETLSLPPCGGYLRANSGIITSPNFPVTYNKNEICEWIIELLDCQKVVEIKFTNFSVAGRMPECPKDQLYIQDGIVSESHTHGPLCHLSLPPSVTTSSNLARIRFKAGPKHGPKRTGFSLTFKAINN